MRKKVNTPIRFHFLTDKFHFENRSRLKNFLLKKIKKQGKSVEAINYIFCSDEYLLEVNRQYLNHDNYTDIITFELSQKDQPLLSDIYISVERVKENTEVFKTSFSKELHRVIFHGALHLCGFKDESKQQAHQMRAEEEQLLNRYFARNQLRY
jgi:probable rRNA maturation factor